MTTATATKTSIKHSKTTTLHVHITRFCTFIANYCTPRVVQCKIPSSTFHRGCKHNRMSHLDWSPRIQFQENSPTFDIFSELELHVRIMTRFDKMRNLFNNVTFLLLLPLSLLNLHLYFDKSLR